MKYIRVISFLISIFCFQNTYAAQFLFSDDSDEFTDEVRLQFLIMDDSSLGGFAANCSNGKFFFAGKVTGMFETKKNIDLKIRFDKDEMITKRIPVVDYSGYLTRDKAFTKDILNRIKNSDMFILKVGTEKTQKFTGYEGIGVEIDKFLDATKDIDACNLI